MPLDPASVWGKAVADAVKALGVEAGTAVTDTQLEAMWTAVKTEDRGQLTGKSNIVGATLTGPAGGPLPITLGPGAIT